MRWLERRRGSKTVVDALRDEGCSSRVQRMLSASVFQAPVILILRLVLSAICAGAQESPTAVVPDATLIHGRAFTQQINLIGPDLSVEHLALTDEDVRYTDVTVDRSENMPL